MYSESFRLRWGKGHDHWWYQVLSVDLVREREGCRRMTEGRVAYTPPRWGEGDSHTGGTCTWEEGTESLQQQQSWAQWLGGELRGWSACRTGVNSHEKYWVGVTALEGKQRPRVLRANWIARLATSEGSELAPETLPQWIQWKSGGCCFLTAMLCLTCRHIPFHMPTQMKTCLHTWKWGEKNEWISNSWYRLA